MNLEPVYMVTKGLSLIVYRWGKKIPYQSVSRGGSAAGPLFFNNGCGS